MSRANAFILSFCVFAIGILFGLVVALVISKPPSEIVEERDQLEAECNQWNQAYDQLIKQNDSLQDQLQDRERLKRNANQPADQNQQEKPSLNVEESCKLIRESNRDDWLLAPRENRLIGCVVFAHNVLPQERDDAFKFDIANKLEKAITAYYHALPQSKDPVRDVIAIIYALEGPGWIEEERKKPSRAP